MAPGRGWRGPATALVLATLLSGRQIASWGTTRNRWDFFWQRQDGVALIVSVLILAAGLSLAGLVLARWEWSRRRRLGEFGLVLTLVAALLSQFPFLAGGKSGAVGSALLWLGVGVVLAAVWKRWPGRLLAGARAIPLILLPLVPILFLQILLWKPWDVRIRSTTPAPTADRTGRPLAVIILFDEWSWFRTANQGLLDPGMPNLRRLAQRSVLVREARSAGAETRVSVPRLLFQSRGELLTGNGLASWRDSSGTRPAPEVPSIFDAAGQLGYRSSVIGFYLNYRSLIGPDQPNQICCAANVYRPRTWPATVGVLLLRNLQHWTDPVSQSLWPRVSARIYSESWVRLVATLKANALETLATAPDNTLLLIHLPLPHPPFIFDADGSFRGAYQGERMSDDSAGYRRHLRYADRVLGEFIDTLTATGRLDGALLIVTSDHSWRKDPDTTLTRHPDALQRVPLLVKWPGQTRPIVSDEPFCALGLWPVLEAAIASPTPPAMNDSTWRAISASGRSRTCVQ